MGVRLLASAREKGGFKPRTEHEVEFGRGLVQRRRAVQRDLRRPSVAVSGNAPTFGELGTVFRVDPRRVDPGELFGEREPGIDALGCGGRCVPVSVG